MTSDRASSRAAMRATIQKKRQLDLGVEMPGGERGLFRLAHCGNSVCAVSNYWRAGNRRSKDNPRFRWGGSASNNAFRKPLHSDSRPRPDIPSGKVRFRIEMLNSTTLYFFKLGQRSSFGFRVKEFMISPTGPAASPAAARPPSPLARGRPSRSSLRTDP